MSSMIDKWWMRVCMFLPILQGLLSFQTPFTYKHRLLQADCNGLINIVSRNLEFTFRALSSTERATTVNFKGGVEKK